MNDMKVLNFKVPTVKNTKQQLSETEYVLHVDTWPSRPVLVAALGPEIVIT